MNSTHINYIQVERDPRVYLVKNFPFINVEIKA